MKRLFLLFLLAPLALPAQDLAKSPWHVPAAGIDPDNYYGVTVANSMVGIVSSPEPLKVKDVGLNGAYDTYDLRLTTGDLRLSSDLPLITYH